MSSSKYSPKLKTDLHVHTRASDGAYTPREVVKMARERSITIMAIADHDTTSGLAEAKEVAQELGVELIPGIELSTIAGDNEIHILGYHIDPHNTQLQKNLQTLSEARDTRAQLIVAKLNELGYAVTMAEVKAKAGSEIIGRPHIALAMIDHELIKNIDEGFARFLSPGGLAYVPRFRVTPQEAIRLIKNAGGLAVLAHPGLNFPARLLPELIAVGLAGIEVNHPDNSLQIRDYYQRRAHEAGLFITGGSDFHGHDEDDFHYFGQMITPPETFAIFQEIQVTRKNPH